MDFMWFNDLANLARTRNFSQAAELGNISQPAFSRRIRALEGWAGVNLVDRSKHPVSLTSAGLQMLEAGQQALARLENERAQIREAQTLPDQYVVTFGAQHSIGWRFYPAWLQAFESAYGAIMSRLRADNLPNCVKDLEAGEVDFVIAYQSRFARSIDRFGSLESIVIGKDALIPVCKTGHAGAPLFTFDDENAPPVPYLRFGGSAPITRHVEPLLDAMDIQSRLGVVYENSMAGALRIRARDGAGVAWLPRSLVQPDLEAGLLVQTGEPDWEIGLEIRLHRLREHANQLTRKIWVFLAARESVPLTVV
jgi:DNA-binding transcriptional LysR family regulator